MDTYQPQAKATSAKVNAPAAKKQDAKGSGLEYIVYADPTRTSKLSKSE